MKRFVYRNICCKIALTSHSTLHARPSPVWFKSFIFPVLIFSSIVYFVLLTSAFIFAVVYATFYIAFRCTLVHMGKGFALKWWKSQESFSTRPKKVTIKKRVFHTIAPSLTRTIPFYDFRITDRTFSIVKRKFPCSKNGRGAKGVAFNWALHAEARQSVVASNAPALEKIIEWLWQILFKFALTQKRV